MKIIYYAHSVLSRGGDKMILAHLAYLAENGHDVSIEANVVDTIFDIHRSITVRLLGGRGKLSTVLKALWFGKNVDLVIATIIPMACFLALRNPKKVVYFSQDHEEESYNNWLGKFSLRLFLSFGLCLQNIPTIAVSEALAEKLKKIAGAEVYCVPNGVDANVFYPDPQADLVAQKHHRKAILVFCRYDFRKGFDLVCRVLEKLKEKSPHQFEVWSVGESPCGLPPEILCKDFGYLDERRLRQVFSSADIFFYPTRNEGFGLMIVEAFACCCPVVTTSAIPFAEDGKNALVSPVEDIADMTEKLCTLLGDPRLITPLVAGGKKIAEHNSLASACRQFENILENELA